MNLTYELVNLHHGQIEAHNVGINGVEITVRIPLGNAHLNDKELESRKSSKEREAEVDRNFENISEKNVVETSGNLFEEDDDNEPKQKYTILVVDDIGKKSH